MNVVVQGKDVVLWRVDHSRLAEKPEKQMSHDRTRGKSCCASSAGAGSPLC